jgi:O-antigen/teichoic acid export membrane protein
MVKFRSQGKEKRLFEVYHSFILLTIFTFILFALISISTLKIINFSSVFKIHTISNEHTTQILSFLSIYTLLGLFSGPINAAWRNEGMYAKNVFIGNIFKYIEAISIYICLYLTSDPVVISKIMLISRFLYYFFIYKIILNKNKVFALSVKFSDIKIIKKLAIPSFLSLGYPLGSTLNIQGYTLLIGFFLGGAAVSIFSILRTLSRIFFQFSNIFYYVHMNEFTSLLHQNKIKVVSKINLLTIKNIFWIGMLSLTSIYFSSRWIIKFWAHQVIIFENSLLAVMLCTSLFSSIWLTFSAIPSSINDYKKISFFYIFLTIIGLFVSSLLIKGGGLIAICTIQLLIEILYSIIVIKKALALLKESFSNYIIKILCYPAEIFQKVKSAIT